MAGKNPTVSAETLASISTPDHVDSRLGPLEFVDGAPSDATATLVMFLMILNLIVLGAGIRLLTAAINRGREAKAGAGE